MKKLFVLLLVIFMLSPLTACDTAEDYELTGDAIYDAFYDEGLKCVVGVGKPNDPSSLLNYAYGSFVEYWGKEVPSAAVFDALAQRFPITDELRQGMLFMAKGMAPYGGWGYNAEKDTFRFLGGTITTDQLDLLGYVHNTGNQYAVYFFYSSDTPSMEVLFKVELEYNRVDRKPNKYLLIEEVRSTPENMIEY